MSQATRMDLSSSTPTSGTAALPAPAAASVAFTVYRDTAAKPKPDPKSAAAAWAVRMKHLMDNEAKRNGQTDAAASAMLDALGATDLASCIAAFNKLKITTQK